MSDRVPPKGKKKALAKGADKKAAGPKQVTHGKGHNSGIKNPEAIKAMDELLALREKKKALAKAERDIRNKFKTEFGILSGTLAHELRLRVMDSDVRVQFESNHNDLKNMLGYQPSLDFQGATPTNASLKAQPSEAELTERDTAPTRGPAAGQKVLPASEPEEDAGEDEAGYDVEDEEEGAPIEREG